MKKSKLKTIGLVIVILLSEHMAYVIPNTPLYPIIGIILCFVLSNGKIIIKHDIIQEYRVMIMFFLLYIVSFLYTFLGGIQPFRDAVVKYLPMIFVLAIFPLSNIYNNRNGKQLYIRDAFIVSSIIVSAIYILQYLLYPGIIIIQAGLSYSGGHIRTVTSGWLLSIGFILILDRLFVEKKRIDSILLILIGLAIVLVNRSRSLIFATAISGLYVFGAHLSKNTTKDIKNKKNKHIFRFIYLVIAIIGLFFAYNYALEVIQVSLSLGESSSVNRMGGYIYYFSLFIKHPILGIGYIGDQNNYGFSSLGVLNHYYIDDIGVVGFLAQFGLLGLICAIAWYNTVVSNSLRLDSFGIKAVILNSLILLPFNCFFNSYPLFMGLILLLIYEYRLYCKIAKT